MIIIGILLIIICLILIIKKDDESDFLTLDSSYNTKENDQSNTTKAPTNVSNIIQKKSDYSSSELHQRIQNLNKIIQQQKEEKRAREPLQRAYFLNTYNLMELKNVTLSPKRTSRKLVREMPEIKYSSVRSTTPIHKVNTFIVIDIETTGLSSTIDKILEISAIKFINGEPIEYLTTLLNPKKEIPIEITNINHITNEMVQDSPEVGYIISCFTEFIKGFNIVGYNLPFDLKFLHVNGMNLFSEKRQFFDVLPLCRKYFKNTVSNYKLDTICDYGEIYRPNGHRATDDALATGIIFRDVGNKIINPEYEYSG